MTKSQILIVEDESIIAEDIRRSLQNLGYSVSAVVSSGEKAIKKVEETSPDLVLMDIMLQGKMDGIEAAEQIRSRFNIPIVYLTAYSDEKILERAKITEPFGYIIKPFKERELYINIEVALYKHKMEKKLRESKEWFSTALKSIGDAVIATDSKGAVIFMNPIAQFMTGWNLEDVLGKTLNDVYNITNEKTSEPVENPVTQANREGVVIGQANQTMLIARDGTKIPIEDSGDPIRDDKGNIIGSVLVFRDITERRQAEEEIIALEEFYESVLEGIVTGVWVTDKNDVILFANKGAGDAMGINPVDVRVLKDFSEFFKPYYLKAKETLQPFYYEAVPLVTLKSGTEYQSGWLIPRIKNGNFNGMICTIESIPKHSQTG